MIHFYLNSYKTPACKVICTEIVSQELLHRSSANFQVIKLYLNSCKIRLLQFFYFSLAAGTARRWLTTCYPLRRVGHPNVWRNAGLVCPLGNPLRRSRVSDGQTCGVTVKCETSLPAATVCGDRSKRPSMWWNVNFSWARATLCRDRAGRASKHVAKCKFGEARRGPSHEMTVNRQKLV